MNFDKQVINELNRFLRGRYMGIHQYEHLIHNAQEPELKALLQRFQEQAKLGAQKVANRIQQLGDEAEDGVGLMGEVREWIQKIKGYPETAEEIVQSAWLGEQKYGIHFSHKMVAGELDEESVKLIDEILEEDQKRADELKKRIKSPQTCS